MWRVYGAPSPLATARNMWDCQFVAVPGSESAHDANVVKLLGESADEVLARPVAYPQLRADQIAAAFQAGKACRIKVPAARILTYSASDGTSKAVVTELPHGGYRRRYRLFEASDPTRLVELLAAEYL